MGLSLVDLALARQERERAEHLGAVKGEEPPRLCALGCGRRLWRNNVSGVCVSCQRAHLGRRACAGGCGERIDPRRAWIYCRACGERLLRGGLARAA